MLDIRLPDTAAPSTLDEAKKVALAVNRGGRPRTALLGFTADVNRMRQAEGVLDSHPTLVAAQSQIESGGLVSDPNELAKFIEDFA